ncbi:hypothetical protein [Azospirillum sp. BE72]|uniref:hypothetical protein n=1 Tax=Azospirillum sp. BE72 TaxID=2817776 RepID=UPI002862149E|nr:hypothetical protein [Azospirillum sp. BE72]MDR6775680.1 hypothetical protein [Azospirillum sp. BE72]
MAALPSAANVHDTRLIPDALCLAMVVCASIPRLYACARYDNGNNRWPCSREGIQHNILKTGQPLASGLGRTRCIVEHANAWLLANKRLDRRHDRPGAISDALHTMACVSVTAYRRVEF